MRLLQLISDNAPPFPVIPGYSLFPGKLSSPFIGYSDCHIYNRITLALGQEVYVIPTMKIKGLGFSALGGHTGFGTNAGTILHVQAVGELKNSQRFSMP